MKTFNDITLKQYKEYMLLEDKTDTLKVVSILIDNYRDKTNEELATELTHIISSEFNSLAFAIIEIDGKLYGLNKSKLTFGEFIDLQNLMDGKNFWEVIEQVLQVYYRPIKKISYSQRLKYNLGKKMFYKSMKVKSDKIKKSYLKSASELITSVKYELEPYNPDNAANLDAISNIKMSEVYGCTLFFWTLIAQFSKTTLNSLEEEMKEKQIKVKE